MPGYFCLLLHAHLPFVRHPSHEKFLEESWLFEAITETYLPLLLLLEAWQRDRLEPSLAVTLTPTLCAMLQDPLLQQRFRRYLDERLSLAEMEIKRTRWDRPLLAVATFYRDRVRVIRDAYEARDGELVTDFRKFQDLGRLEIVTSAATHALLPLLANHLPSLRAQVLVACDHYRSCFGCDPRGIWLPECGYDERLEEVLQAANLRWFVVESHGLLHAVPQPRYGLFAPVFTPRGIAAFGRDRESARQVWSRDEGYPGDPRYRDFYRDIGFDLEFDYVKPFLPSPDARGFTGIKYHRITGRAGEKRVYERAAALRAAEEHGGHFFDARCAQIRHLSGILDRPPLVMSPYDAELFGHWWFEGPEFLDAFVRRAEAAPKEFKLITPEQYLRGHPTQQIARPAPSSWGDEGHWGVWLNEKNEWIQRELQAAQHGMSELAHRFARPDAIEDRALRQAARELLLAQASDWPFILSTGTSPDYASKRVREHLFRFRHLYDQLMRRHAEVGGEAAVIGRPGGIDEDWLKQIEAADNIFPDVNFRYWA